MLIHRVIPFAGLAALWACASPPSPPRGQNLPVAVDVRCTGPDVVFSVSPWHLELAEGDEVTWRLADPAQTIEIRKRQSAWPFDRNRFSGTQADPPVGEAMKGGQRGKTFRYAIVVTCQGGEGARTVELDPDMYIKR
jgi:hypothetical protein